MDMWGQRYTWDGVKQDSSITGGPDRVVTDKPDPDFKPRPVGFTAEVER